MAFLKFARALRALAFSEKSYLVSEGWFRTVNSGVPQDANGKPIPWFNYPMIDFLKTRLSKDLDLFEYGSGNSTLWFSERLRSVVSCEHDSDWAARVEQSLPANCELIRRDLNNGYVEAARETGRQYDIIVVDGRRRNDCAREAVGQLTDKGVIIWDNSDREEYEEGMAELTAKGFKRLPFVGIGPIVIITTETSVFYRDKNCLGL